MLFGSSTGLLTHFGSNLYRPFVYDLQSIRWSYKNMVTFIQTNDVQHSKGWFLELVSTKHYNTPELHTAAVVKAHRNLSISNLGCFLENGATS